MKEEFLPLLKFSSLSFLYDIVLYISGLGPKFKKHITELANINPKKGEVILDIGCGTGTQALVINQLFPDSKTIGIDPDKNLILQLSQAHSNKKNLYFKEAFANNLPLESCSVDIIFSTLTFHHLTTSDKNESFAEIYRVLKNGGSFILTDWGESPVPYMEHFLIFERNELVRDHFKGLIPHFAHENGLTEIFRKKLKPSGIWIWKFTK